MAVHYRIFANDGAGGPLDVTTPVATVTPGTTWVVSPAPAAGEDWTFLVRAYDTVTGLDDGNVEARVNISLDAGGTDLATAPAAIQGLGARAGADGSAIVSWAFPTNALGGAPTGFRVWATAGTSVNYGAAPTTTVAYVANQLHYSVTLTGLTDGQAYAIGARAYNATAEESNTLSASIVADDSAPSSPLSLSATAI